MRTSTRLLRRRFQPATRPQTPSKPQHENREAAHNSLICCVGRQRNHNEGLRRGLMSIRPVKKLIASKPTLEAARVHLRRAFGYGDTSDYDPFLLLDDFRNDVPEDYLGISMASASGDRDDHL